MITKELAAVTREFYHVRVRNADGSPARCRANGKLKTWKREPERWQLPVKHGLKACFYLSPCNAADWCIDEQEALLGAEYPLHKPFLDTIEAAQYHSPEWKAAIGVYADWLEERGDCAEAKRWRKRIA